MPFIMTRFKATCQACIQAIPVGTLVQFFPPSQGARGLIFHRNCESQDITISEEGA